MTARLLMIGIDGADGRTLDRKSADGSLPHIAALRGRGRAQRLCPPRGISDDALWASFQHGVELGDHGRYHYRLPLKNGRLGFAIAEEGSRPTFWETLSHVGQRVAVIDVPKCCDPKAINGLHLVDWSVHGRYFTPPRSQPPSLAREVLEKFGSALPSRCDYKQPTLDDDDVREITGNLRHSIVRKSAAGLHYLEAEPWDLFVICFKEAHCASHAFWDFEEDHPSHDPSRMARVGNPIAGVLRDIDEAVGRLVGSAGPLAEVVVFSTTDYEANGSLGHLMPEIVNRLNPGGSGIAGLLRSVWSKRPDRWRTTILPYNENCTALRLSRGRRERFAHNMQAPGDAQLGAIERELWSLRDVDSGLPVVASITRPSSEMSGSRVRTLPDLLIHWAAGAMPRAVTSPGLGRIEAPPPSLRTGNHVAGGILFASGPVASVASRDVRTIADIAALAGTVLIGSANAAPSDDGLGSRPITGNGQDCPEKAAGKEGRAAA